MRLNSQMIRHIWLQPAILLRISSNKTVVNGVPDSPALAYASLAADGKQLTLNFTRGLDTSGSLSLLQCLILEIPSSANGDWTSSQQVTYAVDGDSTDYRNGGQTVVLLLENSLLHSGFNWISYSAATLADSASPSVNELLGFSQVDATNLSMLFLGLRILPQLNHPFQKILAMMVHLQQHK